MADAGRRRTLMHGVLALVLLALILLLIIYPFLPGEYDRLALPLSMMAQVGSVVSLLLAPVGSLWLVYEVWKRVRHRRTGQFPPRATLFAFLSLIALFVVGLVTSVVATMTAGLALGLLSGGLWILTLVALGRRAWALRRAESSRFNPVPLYLIGVPITAVAFQAWVIPLAMESSRSHAIAMSAPLIHDIERYYTQNEHYPASLLAAWRDYSPSVVGIEGYHYQPQGEGYSIFFEQPRFLFDDFGAREFVMYNAQDQYVMISHTSWILLLRPAQARANPGWYDSMATSTQHWRRFLFD
ncbi:MAG: hypothetical protein IPK19_14090 [Chloroflexi bacterium]|nr:hypothetical protein [Chloroflexota bacterium]